MAVDFNYFLGRKYALLAQNADADTQRANASTLTAQTGATVGAAQAALDNIRARLMPGESAANVRRMNAEANLTNNQAQTVIPLAQSTIGLNASQARSVDINADIAANDGLVFRPNGIAPGGNQAALDRVLGRYALPKLSPLTLTAPRARVAEDDLENGVRVRRGSY